MGLGLDLAPWSLCRGSILVWPTDPHEVHGTGLVPATMAHMFDTPIYSALPILQLPLPFLREVSLIFKQCFNISISALECQKEKEREILACRS